MMMLGEMNKLDLSKTESGMESSQRLTGLKKLPIASKQKPESKKPVIPLLDFSQLKGDHALPKKQVQASKQ